VLSFLVGFLFLQTVCFSATIYVPDDHATIQDAITAAVDGDTVVVRPGTYVENIDFLGKAITVQSEQGPDVTIIDGNSAGTVVTFESGEDHTSVLEGFTIQNGTGTFNATYSWYEGGGIYLLNSSATVNGCTVKDNSADQGGGVGTRNACPEITDCLFLGNTAAEGGGGYWLLRELGGTNFVQHVSRQYVLWLVGRWRRYLLPRIIPGHRRLSLHC